MYVAQKFLHGHSEYSTIFRSLLSPDFLNHLFQWLKSGDKGEMMLTK